jgi:tetratricopeptide (TPR) repeat protein
MPIDDPTAIPETSEQAAEYLREADDFWSNHRHDEAMTLYFAVLQSPFEDTLPQNRQGEIMYRVGQVAEQHGDIDRAYRAYHWGSGEGHEESRRRLAELQGELPDETPDPDSPPTTPEALQTYTVAASQAEEGDPELAARLYEACLNSSVITPGNRGDIAYRLGLMYQRTGSHDAAYQMFDEAATNAAAGEYREGAVTAMRQYQQQDGTDHDDVIASGQPVDEDDAGRYLQAAIDAYDRGDTGRAEAIATIVASSSAASAGQQGGAHYYLGAIAYYANNFDVARTHLTHASEHAEDPYRDWAQQMLDWRWQEG